MPTYYFDVIDGVSVVDDGGTPLADDNAARDHAIAISGELLKSKENALWRGDEWTIHVRGDDDRVLYSLAFRAKAPA